MPEHHKRNRILRMAAVALAVEIALAGFNRIAPALASIGRTAMWIVAIATAFSIWQGSRNRGGGDRRHADRRA